MKTLTLFLVWVLTRVAWTLLRCVAPNSRVEPFLSDAEVMLKTDAEVMLAGVVKALVEA